MSGAEIDKREAIAKRVAEPRVKLLKERTTRIELV